MDVFPKLAPARRGLFRSEGEFHCSAYQNVPLLIRVYGGLGRAAEVNSTLHDDGVTVSRLTRNEETLQEFLERLIASEGGDA